MSETSDGKITPATPDAPFHVAVDRQQSGKKSVRGSLFRMVRYAVLLSILLAILSWWFMLRSRPLVVSPETTVITEPLTPDGCVDYFAALKQLEPAEIATDANGLRVVLRELEFCSVLDTASKNALYAALELDPNLPPRLPALNHYTAWKNWLHAENPNLSDDEIFQLAECRKINNPAEWFDEMTDSQRRFTETWLAENAEAFDLLTNELKKEIFVLPLFRTDDNVRLTVHFPEISAATIVQEFRQWQRLLSFRASARIEQGDIAGAVDDILSMKRLARHVLADKTKFMINGLVGIALDGIAIANGIGGNLDHPPTREEWQRLLDDATQNDFPFDWGAMVNAERFCVLGELQRMSYAQSHRLKSSWDSLKKRPDERGMPDLFGIFFSPGFDWSAIARQLNRRIDALANGVIPDESNQGSPKFSQYITLHRRTNAWMNTYGSLLLNAFPSVRSAVARLECCRNMARINFAMQLYRADHDGKLPPAFTTDENGKPLHSWRVLLLPYLGYEEIFSQIQLDEPWNSETNKRFHHSNIPEYRCPASDLFQAERNKTCNYPRAGETTYSVIIGPDTLFSAHGGDGIDPVAARQADPARDTLRQLTLIERVDPILWMRPDAEIPQSVAQEGINLREASELRKIRSGGAASFHHGGMNGAIADGRVQFFSQDIKDDERHQYKIGITGKAPKGDNDE